MATSGGIHKIMADPGHFLTLVHQSAFRIIEKKKEANILIT